MSEASPARRRRLVLGTYNEKKRREMHGLLSGYGFDCLTLADFDGIPEAAEEGATFLENARTKARSYAVHTGLPCLADDSGLAVDALDGEPGVRSARFAGPEATDEANRTLLLRRLSAVAGDERSAHFHCAIVLAGPGGEILFEAERRCEGRILAEAQGTGGFGYDPLFFSPDLGKTFARASQHEKDHVSHRGRALRALLAFLESA
jgi:XTP/dITP diphosphohydrolase